MGKILVVDDDESWRNIGQRQAGYAGHESETASNRREAMVLLSTNQYDLILSDNTMPASEGETIKSNQGLELLRWVRSQVSLSKTPFILQSGDDDAKVFAEQLGGVFRSKISRESLVSLIRKLLP